MFVNAFQPRALRTVNNQATYNKGALKPANQNIKDNILSLKSLNIGGGGNHSENGIANLKAAAAKEMNGKCQDQSSKIPVLRSRIPVCIATNQQENRMLDVQQKQQSVVAAAAQKKIFVVKKPVVSIENIDTDTNCFLLSEYAPEIYKYLREVELKQYLEPNFLSNQGTVAAHMRGILINWIIQVHQSFRLSSETLYISVSMADRYFAREPVVKNRIQLVGITALFIAAKYEEIYYPEISEFVAVCDKLYTKKDIIRMELHMLGVLKFELGRPLPLHFLRRGSKAAHADGHTHMLAKYLCELMLCEYETAHWNPSLLAATALYTALRLVALEKDTDSPTTGQNADVWSPTIEHYTGYSKAQVVKYGAVMCRKIVASETSKYQNCRKKYASPKFMEISKLPALSHKLVKKMAGHVVSEK